MEKWFIKYKKRDYRRIKDKYAISGVVAKLLINRDIYEKNEIEIFLNPNLDKLISSDLMKDLSKGAKILLDKINSKRKIRIVGDFDVDGVMSVYILYKGLKELGAEVDYVIPDRVLDGYGINIDIIDAAKTDEIDTIITCDNGIAAIEQINYAKELGLTVIVTDHHDIPYKEDNDSITYISSNADAIINPKQRDCKFPFKNLCGAGIVYKFIKYLFDLTNKEIGNKFLEFVAIATICDVVDLVGENRILVKEGLQALHHTRNIGLRALIDICGISEIELGVYHIGFIIGPTINASGRLDTALYALKLLLCEDVVLAYEMAKNLKDLNEERKKMTTEGVSLVVTQIENKKMHNSKILVVYEPKIHESIAGIIAGRIKDIYNRPTIILTKGMEGAKGSARSIDGYNIFEELSKNKDLLNRFGGHPMAAGLSLEITNIDELRNRLNMQTNLTKEDLISKIYIDMQLPIEYINYKLIDEIKILEPYGKGNTKPLFGDKNLKIEKGTILGTKKNVLKLVLLSKDGCKIEGLIFNDTDIFIGKIEEKYGKRQLENMYRGIESNICVDILYYPDVNEYKGNTTLQVIIKHFRLS